MRTTTEKLQAEVGALLFPMVKVAAVYRDSTGGSGQTYPRSPAPSASAPTSTPWYQYAQSQMRNYGGQYGAPVAAGGLAGAGAYGLGQALGFSPGASALGAAVAAPAVGYLTNRFQQGHFNPLFQPGGMSWSNVGKALWGDNPQPAKQ